MTIEELIDAEARLGRAFVGHLFAVASALAWPMVASSISAEPTAALAFASLGLLVVQIGLYVWFAMAAGAAARSLAVSPLSITFLLGRQLQTAIREQTSMAMHVSA